tara:strand:+ start:632 stop:859 length:228 start_codon:yes stop_codon:yes gene_type:complete
MKISIGRLKEIVMEEVARATKKEETLMEAETQEQCQMQGGTWNPAAVPPLPKCTYSDEFNENLEESLNIEIVDDE